MEVESDITVEDLRALRRFFLRTHPGRDVVLTEYLTVAFFGFIPYFLLAGTAADRLRIWIPSEYVIGLAATQLLVWTLLYLWALNHASHVVVQRSATVATGHHKLTVGDAGIREERPHGEVAHRWFAVTGVHDQRQHVFIAVGPDGYYVIPKRSFATPDDVVAFLTKVRYHQAESATRAGLQRA